MQKSRGTEWVGYTNRYASGEWRARVFRDMILGDVRRRRDQCGRVAVLDIGCGAGFDSDPGIQHQIADVSDEYIGVEPDQDIKLGESFKLVHRALFEDAPIDHDSIDVAFAIMVMEHIERPLLFWNKVYEILKPGGVFWGFTVDSRGLFAIGSSFVEKIAIKDRYLDWLHGKRGQERYENYDVFYRTNSPRQIAKFTDRFSKAEFINFAKVGQLDFYLPAWVRPAYHIVDRIELLLHRPGAVLAVRVQK